MLFDKQKKLVKKALEDTSNGTLNLMYMALDKIPEEVRNMTHLERINLNGNCIKKITEDELPPNVKVLNLRRNKIDSLEDCHIPESVITLNLSNNQLTDFDGSSLTKIKVLLLNHNNIRNLKFPPNIQSCSVSYNCLTSLEDFPDTLLSLIAINNCITALPEINDKLEIINVSQNALTEFPTFPDSVKEIYISHNINFSVLDKPFPSSLNIFKAYESGIDEISAQLPAGLELLDLSGNNLSEVPNLPLCVVSVNLSNNQLVELSDIPDSVEYLDVSHNRLSEIPKDLLEDKKLEIIYDNNFIHVENSKSTGVEPLKNTDFMGSSEYNRHTGYHNSSWNNFDSYNVRSRSYNHTYRNGQNWSWNRRGFQDSFKSKRAKIDNPHYVSHKFKDKVIVV